MYTPAIRSDELYHYGVMGMKWGVRRYQNYDGTWKNGKGKERHAKQASNDIKTALDYRKRKDEAFSNYLKKSNGGKDLSKHYKEYSKEEKKIQKETSEIVKNTFFSKENRKKIDTIRKLNKEIDAADRKGDFQTVERVAKDRDAAINDLLRDTLGENAFKKPKDIERYDSYMDSGKDLIITITRHDEYYRKFKHGRRVNI